MKLWCNSATKCTFSKKGLSLHAVCELHPLTPEVKRTCVWHWKTGIKQSHIHAQEETTAFGACFWLKRIEAVPFSVCVRVCVHYLLVLVHSRESWCLCNSPRVLFCRSICRGCSIPQLVEPSGPQACHHIRGSAGTHHWAPPPAAGGGRAPEGEETRPGVEEVQGLLWGS